MARGGPSASACLFPIRSHGRGDKDKCALHARQIGSQTLQEVTEYCERNTLRIDHFLMVVWAVILQQFTENRTIHMGLQQVTLLDSACSSGMGMKSRMRTVSRSFSQATSLSELLQADLWTTTAVEAASFNTGLVICSPCSTSMSKSIPSIGTTTSQSDSTCDVLLTLHMGSGKELPTLWLLHRTSILCDDSAQYLADSIIHIIKCMTQGDALDSSRLSTLSATQRAKIYEWNRNKAGGLSSKDSLYHAIHQTSLQDPDNPAICSWDGDLTYSQLMDVSRRWAFKLRELGAGPGVMIPVCFEKSLWPIVAMLAINQVGAAFVPLDPSHPPDHLKAILKVLNPKITLASSLQHELLGDSLPCSWRVSESSTADLPDYGTEPFLSEPSDYAGPAYCLFTSGSTGTPKGCVVHHAALASVANQTAALQLDRSSRVLQFASFSFGVSLIEIWCSLCAGATVCIPSDADRLNRLPTMIATMQVNWAILTPTILDLLPPEAVPSLQTIVVAGEPLKESQKSLWAGRTRLFQGYGLTEWAGIFSVSPQIHAEDKVSSIGMPQHGSCWLVDPHDPDQLVGIGVVGELVIQGPSLAQGYLQDPHKTAISFMVDPRWAPKEASTKHQRQRFYRTGDLAFFHCDGSLQYVGRKDLQLKIRGQRITLSVIEHHLAHGSPALRGAVVDAITLADEDQLRLAVFVPNEQKPVEAPGLKDKGQKRTIFAVPDQAFTSKADAAKRRLQGQLPRYMVPDIFLCVNQLPVTVTGKIARRQLRDQVGILRSGELAALTGLGNAASHTEPSTPHERLIHGLITELLKLPPHAVGMGHNFFALGGDSVQAMKVVGLARQRGLALTVKDIFDAPDLRTLAQKAKASLQLNSRDHATPPFSLLRAEARQTIVQAASDLCHVPLQQIEDIYPCTPLQEGMMALGGSRPGTYVARFICQIDRQVDLSRLRSSWATVVAANPILRTRIIQVEGNCMHQVVLKEEFKWDADDEWQSYLDNDRYTSMTLGDPLVRGAVLRGREDPRTMFLVLTMHHSVCDRWAVGLWLKQLHAVYQGESPRKHSFAAFVKYIREAQGSKSQSYWENQFAGLEAETFPPLPSQDYRPCPSESLQLQVTGDAPTGATMSSFIRLAWALVISQYTAANDTVFGVTVTGRNAPVDDVENLPAPTISTLPFRVQIDPDRTVKDAVAAIQQQSSEMIPFEQAGLQNIRKYSREAQDACGFQTHLVVQPAWQDDDRSESFLHLIEDGASVQRGFASYAIVLLCSLTKTADINITSEFDPDVIPPSIMQHILGHFGNVLQYILAHPHSKLLDVPISDFDAARLREWCSVVPQSQPECVHEVIRQRIIESPNACAVHAWDGSLSYAQLDGMSTRLSIWLALQGVGPEIFVPLCFEKSRWTIVALLAVMKAGAAFVLLDPSQPLQRLRDICEQTNSPVILASEQNADLAARLQLTVRVVSQTTLHQLPACLENQRGPVVHPSTALYVVFTSGSTGTPKGVVVEHQSYCAGAKFHIHGHRMSSQSRMFQFASYAFDTSIIEMLSTLMAGACICVPSEHDRQNDLARVVEEMAVTHGFLTPSVARALARTHAHPFEVVILVGEPMTASDIAYWTQHARLMNEYGPAECSVCATLNPEVGQCSDPRDIGKGMGAICWIVDPEDHDHLRPIGATGELLIEGPIVSRGYLGNTMLTAEKFLAEPPAWLREIRRDGPRTRVYKTGDLVRYNPDGSLHYVGRKDTQVKLRGQRVELGEVENGVRCCMPGIVDVVAETFVPRGGAQGQPCLVAFIWSEDPCQIPSGDSDDGPLASVTDAFHGQVAACLEDLDKFLPRYMIPDVFIPLRRIPTNVSGKANRCFLRELAGKLSWAELAAYQPKVEDRQTPMSDAERTMREVWAQVLNVAPEEIGVNDSFYHLRGDSISAMQVVALSRSRGLFTSVQHILRHRSIARIIQHVQKLSTREIEEAEEVPGVSFGLSPIQRMFFDIQADPRQQYNQSFLLRLSSAIEMRDIERAARAVLKRHSMLRARFKQQPDGQWGQMITDTIDGSYRCTMHTLSKRDGWDYILARAQQAINIETGPVFSLDLLRAASDGQYLFLVAHHLVTDLVSWRIILSDLEAFLGDPTATGAVNKPQPLSFQVWCRLQEQYSQQHLDPATALPAEAQSRSLSDPRPFWGLAGQENVMGDRIVEHFTVGSDLTQQLLGPANVALNTRPEEIFHAVLLSAFHLVFPDRGASPPLIFVKAMAESRGTLPSICPKHLIEILRLVKDTRRTIPQKGWAYFTSRYLHPEGRARFETKSPMEIVLNYAGEYQQFERRDALFVPDSHSILGSLDAGDRIERLALFDVSISVQRGCLAFEFMYNRRMSHQRAIKAWIQASRDGLAQACRVLADAPPQPTLSDFALLQLPYAEFGRLVFETLPDLGVQTDNVEDMYVCSPVQRGMLLSQAKDGGLYNVRVTWKIEPATAHASAAQRIEDAWQQVVDRHAVLRTVVVETGSSESYLVQVVLKRVTPDIAHTDLPGRDRHPWPKGRPLHRMTLVKTNEAFLCHIRINHAMVDATTMDIIYRDFELAYHGKLSAHPAPPFRDVISYLCQKQPPEEEAREYWTAYLSGVQPCHFPRLNFTKRRRSDREHIARIHLSARDRLDAFCRTRNVSTWSVICLAWTLVLRSFTYSDDVCFGYVKSARDLPIENVEEIAGPLLNVLPLLMSVSEGLTIDAAVQAIKDDYLGSLAHQTFALSDMHRIVQGSNQALFNTIVDVQRRDQGGEETETPRSIRKVSKEEVTEYDLVLSVDALGSEIDVQLRYKTTCVSEEQATSILATFEKALQAIIADDQKLVQQNELCSEHDKALLWSRNKTVPRSVEACVHDLISKHHGDRPAVCAWDGDLTYRQLDQSSSQLAMHLRTQGAGPGVVIPLCFSKSRWTPVAMLAVMKSGAAFLVLDPSHPYQRLTELCSKVDYPMIVSAESHTQLSAELTSNIIVLGDNHTSWPSAAPLLPRVRPKDVLYVVFTSGSTGSPKGVVIDHRAYCTSASAHMPILGLDSSARVAQFSSYAFDVSIMDHLTTLIAGGCICIPSDSQRHDDLAETIRQLRVTHAVLVPSVARLLPADGLDSLSTLAMAGESMTGTDVARWAGSVRLINAYGPAECSVLATAQGSVRLDTDHANIGHPMGCVCWVVRPENPQQLVPIGAVGELVVEGPIVARGYFNDPTKSAEVFGLSLPWLEHHRSPQDRHGVYRTGDLVRMHSDGTLTYVGRRDNQVKLRGQRIELGEVEEHIRQCCAGASEVVAEVLIPPGASNPQLVAFVWISSLTLGSAAGDVLAGFTDEFQAFVTHTETRLRQAVPAFLMPSIFIPLARIPRTGSGKIDRRSIRDGLLSLPAGALDPIRRRKAPKVEPRTHAERQLQKIWAEVLHLPLEDIGTQDHFFHLGGDSIDAMKVAALARGDGLAVGVSDIFNQPVLTLLANVAAPLAQGPVRQFEPFSLSRVVDADPQALSDMILSKGMVPSPVQIVDAFPATEVQEFFVRRNTLHYYNFRLRGRLDIDRLRAACDEAMSRFSILRTVFLDRHGSYEQLVLEGVRLPFEHYTFGRDFVSKAQALWEDDRSRFEIARELPVRFILVSGCDTDHLFTIRISHAQWDGVSMPRLFQDLAAAYNGVALSPTSGFSDVIYQRAVQRGEAGFSFWREYLDGAVMTIPFPLNSECNVQPQTGQTLWHVQETALPSLPPGPTMATPVIAACGFHVARLTSRTDLTFGQTVNGRSMPLENIDVILGPCLNFIPLRLRLHRSWTVRDLLQHVQDQYVRPLQYDYMELRDIVQQSTDWAEGTEFGFIVQHQNIQLQHELPLEGDVQVEYSLFPQFDPVQEVFVFSEPHQSHLEMQVCANSRVLAPDAGKELVKALCETLELFADNLDMVLPLPLWS
ncbi:nonribosomal peptide synthase [Aspergillus viridinutans]|uniref:Nonribosomal peptide synthase n=1 Tax=Aspergillus viridinutans TaxID=75553 RepID=A0A9P3BL98_ASPVI|nr:nonribosomal peptide synthase [Aspergillus viridinutans]GIJ98274.1 nonribosomal peptide synthase [Aspergillus viridinutans]